MSTRLTRRNQPDPELSSLSKLDCLILAQSVYEFGASSWSAVAKLLSKHPLLQHPKSFFTAQTCEALYKQMRNDAALEMQTRTMRDTLAQIYYEARVLELRDLISVEEQKFKKVLSEIEELKNNAKTAPPDETKMDLDPEEEAAAPESEVMDKSKGEMEEVESLAIPNDQNTPAPLDETLGNEITQQDAAEAFIDNTEDDVSRASQATTPHEWTAEPEQDQNEAVDQEGVNSGDEPLQKARRAKAAKRQRKASTPLPTRKSRRSQRTPVLDADADMAPEATDNTTEELVQTPGTVDGEASPAPDEVSRRQGKRRASFSDDNPRETRRLRADSELIDDEDELPSSSRPRRQDTQASKRFQNVIGMLHSQISAHRNGAIFHNPIKNSEAPDYHEIVKRPMDLKTIKSKIKDGAISNSLEFQRDIYLMFANAMMYNRPGSDVYNMTEDMMLECEGYIQTFRQSEGFVRGTQR
ncbi:hypothetical protein C8R42DRAFT_720059 [Lentinula raphanica]|nr:hypothetical protein C8R42DRAFT_720059 [Lentinula raphanica]